MPDVTEALDHNRCRELMVKSVLAANLWLALNLAAQRDDATDIKTKIGQIIELTRSANALVKALGTETTDD